MPYFERSKIMNYSNGLARSRAQFQPETCKTGGDMGPQTNERTNKQTNRETLFYNTEIVNIFLDGFLNMLNILSKMV